MTVILGSSRDWLVSAMQGVLDGEDVPVLCAGTLEELTEASSRVDAKVVILDEKLNDGDTLAAIRVLLDGHLPRHVPLLVYSSDLPDPDYRARMLDAGAWSLIEEPIRSNNLLALLRRFVDLSSRMEGATGNSDRGDDRLRDVDSLLERLPVVESLARREQVGLAMVAIGPTYPGGADLSGQQGRRLADLCEDALRKSDLFASLEGDGDLAVVAYAATRDGARTLAERLASVAARRSELSRPEDALSAGIVEITPDDLPDDVRAGGTVHGGEARFLTAAREALQEAREAGGGVRFAS